MQNKKKLLQDLTGERVTIYTVEKEFTGALRKFDNEFSVANTTNTVIIKPADIVDFKRLSALPIIFVHNHFPFSSGLLDHGLLHNPWGQ